MRATTLALLAVAACECGPPSEHAPPMEEPPDTGVSLAEYFPLGLGDRWVYEVRIAGQAPLREGLAITAHQGDPAADGSALLYGAGRASAQRFRFTAGAVGGSVRDDTIFVLDEQGRALYPWLQAPLTPGETWAYTEGETRCRAEVVGEREVSVAGLALPGCVEIERSCTHPAGRPLPQAAVERHEEQYCPDVGLVWEHLSVTVAPGAAPPSLANQGAAPPEATPIERTRTLTRFRVAGGPALALAAEPSCDGLLLLTSDVQRACPGYVAAGSRPLSRGCALLFSSPTGAQVAALVGSAPFGDDTLAELAEPLEIVEQGVEGWSWALARTPNGCAGAARLGPVVQSLLRP